MRIPHQYLLFSLQSDVVKLHRVVTADAGACWPTVAIIGKAVAVELKTARFAAIAGLVVRDGSIGSGRLLGSGVRS